MLDANIVIIQYLLALFLGNKVLIQIHLCDYYVVT